MNIRNILKENNDSKLCVLNYCMESAVVYIMLHYEMF